MISLEKCQSTGYVLVRGQHLGAGEQYSYRVACPANPSRTLCSSVLSLRESKQAKCQYSLVATVHLQYMTIMLVLFGVWVLSRLPRAWYWFGPGSQERIREQVRQGRTRPYPPSLVSSWIEDRAD